MKNTILSMLLAFSSLSYGAPEALGLNSRLRLDVDSGWFNVPEENLDFTLTYNGWDIKNHTRIRHRGIESAGLKIVQDAQKQIVASYFLFDTMYSDAEPVYDVTGEFANSLIKKKKEIPSIKIVVILDAFNRSYSRRMPPHVKRMLDSGIDIFYSDMISTKASTKPALTEFFGEINRTLDLATAGLVGSTVSQVASFINIPTMKMDGYNVDLEVGFGASLIKVNHRKILVGDVNGSDEMQAIVSSANPHNGSDDSTNTALLVKGEMAKYIYAILREDAGHSLNHESNLPLNIGPDKYAQISKQNKKLHGVPSTSVQKRVNYLNDLLPRIDYDKLNRNEGSTDVKAKFVTEEAIKRDVLRLLKATQPDDEVRIQMFYLSEPEVVKAISDVANQPGRTIPVRLLLDPSKDAFGQIKDGTPNRQVGHYLMTKGGKVEIRWYATHGEQNHAKIMSITNSSTGKNEITTGSCNWTGKNMNNVNMEANLSVAGSAKLNSDFNKMFDRFWNNEKNGILYSVSYKNYDLESTQAMLIGAKRLEKLTQEDKQKLALAYISEISEIFLSDVPDNTRSSIIETELWIQEKIQKDSASLNQALSLIVGKKRMKNHDSWKKKYLRKWTRGEGFGFVSW